MSVVRTVLIKELRETSRDWKALVITYGMPLIVYPILFMWMAEAVAVRTEREKAEKYNYARLGVPSQELDQALVKLDRLTLRKLDGAESLEQGAKAWTQFKAGTPEREEIESKLRDELRARGVHVLLWASAEGAKTRVRVYFDPTDGPSGRATDLVMRRMSEFEEETFKARLAAQGIAGERLYPLHAERALLSGKFRTAVPIFGPVLLSFLIIILCLAAYYPALGATVTERENGTLSTLLCAPARPRDIVLGKFLAVWLSSLLGLLSYAIPALIFRWASGASAASGSGLERIPTAEIPWVVVSLLGLSLLLSSISLALGFLARKQSIAQAMLSVLLLSSMLPGLLVNSGDIEMSAGAALVPFMNLAVLSKTLFVRPIAPAIWLLSIAVNAITGFLVFAFSCHLLENEVRGEPALVRLRRVGTTWLREPTADLALLYYAVALGLSFYVGVALSSASLVLTLFLPQLLFILGGPVALVRGLGLSARETFLLRVPRWGAWPASVLLALAMAGTMAAVMTHVHIPELMTEELKKKLGFDGASFLFMALVAVLPALCEEVAFRGFILSGLLRRFSPPIAVVMSALMFAFMHVSLVRFVPTFAVGLALGFVAYRTRSIWPGMLVHGLYNLTLVTLSRSAGAANVEPVAFLYILGGAVVLLAALVWLARATRPLAGAVTGGNVDARLAS